MARVCPFSCVIRLEVKQLMDLPGFGEVGKENEDGFSHFDVLGGVVLGKIRKAADEREAQNIIDVFPSHASQSLKQFKNEISSSCS